MAIEFMKNVAVAMQSALAASVSITGITKANPAVVSHSGTDPSDGDYVVLEVQGMSQVNKRVLRVAGAAAGSFQLEGIDSTLFDTFVSGNFQVVTFGTSFSTLTDISSSGGDPEFVDTTTLHDAQRSQVPITRSPLSYEMQSFWQPGDAALDALAQASDAIAARAIKFTFPSGAVYVFNGTVSYSDDPQAAFGEPVKSAVTFSAQGGGKSYAAP